MRVLILGILLTSIVWGQSLETQRQMVHLLVVGKKAYELKNIKNPPMDCDYMFELDKSIWESKKNENGVVIAGKLSLFDKKSESDQKYFALTEKQIKELAKTSGHEVLRVLPKKKLDGMQITYKESRKFPHSPPGYMQRSECIEHTRKKFKVTTQLIERMDKLCREVKFQNKENSEQVYYLTICADDKNVYQSYHAENEFTNPQDKIECKK